VVEVGSFVSPKWVPQMANSKELYQQINKLSGVSYPCLVPNSKGMETAVEIGVREIAIFASATEGFSRKNLNCSIKESIDRFLPVVQTAKEKGIKVRGYVSMVMGCPFDGEVQPSQVRWVAEKLLEIGCYEVSLGDTVGRGTVEKTRQLFEGLKGIPPQQLAAHFHDTFDNAIENILTAISYGKFGPTQGATRWTPQWGAWAAVPTR
jgi:hydroxymethylglutaryl-CoA lyase